MLKRTPRAREVGVPAATGPAASAEWPTDANPRVNGRWFLCEETDAAQEPQLEGRGKEGATGRNVGFFRRKCFTGGFQV